MSSDPIFFDDSYLQEYKEQKRLSRHRKRSEADAYVFREKCKSIALLALAGALVLVMLGWALYLARVPKERVVERVEVPEIVVQLPENTIEGSDQAPGVSQPVIDSLVNRPAATGSDISQEVTRFEYVPIDDYVVTTGWSYSPPYDDGLTDPYYIFCYVHVGNNMGQNIRVDLYNSLREVRHGDQNIANLLPILEWQNLKNSCQN